MGIGADCIIDPSGDGPRIWFQMMPEAKTVKNRLHLDIHASGGRSGRPRCPAGHPQAANRRRGKRMTDLGATITGDLSEDGVDPYAVAMKDPEGNEFDVN